MKKVLLCICAFIVGIMCLSGCGGKQNETTTPVEQYYYECDLELERVMPGYINYDFLLTSNWAMEYASYENSSATGYDYAINITYSNGECNRFTRNCGPGEAVLGIGYVVGCEDFLLIEGNCEMSDRPAKWSVVTYDKQGNKKSEQDITAVLKDCSVMMLCEIAQNSSNEFHISISDYTTNKVDYKVLSGDGIEKYSSAFFDCRFEKFLTTAEEQIAFEINDGTSDSAIQANDSKVHRVYVYDESIGKEREVYSFDEKYNEDECIKAVSFFDSERLVFVTGNGIYFSDYSLNNVVQINSFDTQAFITSPDTLDIVCDDECGYWLVMERISNGIKTCLQHYVQLSNDVKTIELALDMTAGADIYSEAIVEFNKKHSDYKIVVNSSYDETVLNTMLIAGNGPVIVDSSLMSASGNTDMWESLDDILNDPELSGEINSSVKELMSVNGKCYAITADYYFDTMVSAVADGNMTYSQLLQYLSENTEAKYLMDNELVMDVPVWLAVDFFGGNLDDSFYIDDETGDTLFYSEEFDNMLSCIDKYTSGMNTVSYFDGLDDGEVIYNFVGINNPKDLFFWNEMSNQGISIVGFPKGDGAYSRIHTSHSLMLRSSASEEEKQIAYEFFRLLLSKETQLKMMQSPNFHFSVRNDVLNEQICTIKSGDYISMEFFATDRSFIIDTPEYDEIEAFWQNIVSESILYNSDEDYEDILRQEFDDYFSGKISKDLLKDHLKNRVELFIHERGY